MTTVPQSPHVPTLTDRYVQAAARGTFGDDRVELERELRASIADDVEHRVEAGATPCDAEREALNDLGDPVVLSARYRGSPTVVVGPRTYADWVRWTRTLLLGVLPVLTLIAFVAEALALGSIVAAIGPALGRAVNLAAWLIAVPTVICYYVERSDVGRANGPWTVDELPDRPGRERLTEMLVLVTFAVLGAGAIVYQQVVGFAGRGGVAVPVLDPTLWSGAIPLFLAGLALAVVLVVVRFRSGRSTVGLLTASLIVRVLLYGTPAILAWQQRLLAPQLVTALDLAAPATDEGTISLVVAVCATGLLVWSLVSAVQRHRRDRS